MIRPFTFVALLLAGTSGLYLYQTKHRAEVLDGEITHTLRQVAAARERIGLLRAEWALLNEPDRLGQLAGQHLDLQPLQPSRFVATADLASRIPVAAPETPADAPVAEDTPASPPGDLVRVAGTATTQAAQAAVPAPAAPVAPPRPTLVAAAHAPSPPQSRPVPSRPAERASAMPHETPHETGRPAYSPASSFVAEPVATQLARRPVFAPVLKAMATPIGAPSLGATQVGLVTARPPIPVVTSALGGFGRSSLAPPIPLGGR